MTLNKVSFWSWVKSELAIRESQRKAESMKKKGCCNEPQDNGRCCSQFDGDRDSFVERWILIIVITAVSVLLASLIFGSCDAGAEEEYQTKEQVESCERTDEHSCSYLSEDGKTATGHWRIHGSTFLSDLNRLPRFLKVPGICQIDTEYKRVKLLSPDVSVEYWAGDLPKMPNMETVMQVGSNPIRPMDSSDYQVMERKAGY